MGIGSGVALIVVGLIFLLNVVQVDIPWINEYALGYILVLGGVATVILSLTLWRTSGPIRTRRGTTTVMERRVEPDDPIL